MHAVWNGSRRASSIAHRLVRWRRSGFGESGVLVAATMVVVAFIAARNIKPASATTAVRAQVNVA
jgi:hypothetical protein